ncbi:MAG: PspC domain-containing protein [Chloroflexota bacterium]
MVRKAGSANLQKPNQSGKQTRPIGCICTDDPPSNRETRGWPAKLFRPTEGRVVGGVCAGLGRYFDIDPVCSALGSSSSVCVALAFSPTSSRCS